MNESEYYASEITDAELDRLADSAEFYLEESGFFMMPTQEEIQKMADMGDTPRFMDWFMIL